MGGREVATMQKSGQEEGGDLAVSGHPFQCGLCRDMRAFKSPFIIILLC